MNLVLPRSLKIRAVIVRLAESRDASHPRSQTVDAGVPPVERRGIMPLTKASQWIVWDARKHGKSFDEVLKAAHAKGVTDTDAELEQAYIGTRPYSPQPQRVVQAKRVQANPFEQAWARLQQAIEEGLLSEDEATGYADQIRAKEKAIADKAKADRLQRLSEQILAL